MIYRDTIFTIIVYPEMYRDTVFTIVIYPDMYHDTVSFVVSSRFSCVLCFCGCTRASLLLFGFSNTRLSPDGSSQNSRSKVFNVETSQLEGISCHEWYSVLFGSTQLSLLLSTRCEPLLSTRLETWNSRGMFMDLSRGMKVNEFDDLRTSEFVFEKTEEKPNTVWSGRKHLENHEYINEPLDQVKPDSCFQSSDEGPSLLLLLLFFSCVD